MTILKKKLVESEDETDENNSESENEDQNCAKSCVTEVEKKMIVMENNYLKEIDKEIKDENLLLQEENRLLGDQKGHVGIDKVSYYAEVFKHTYQGIEEEYTTEQLQETIVKQNFEGGKDNMIVIKDIVFSDKGDTYTAYGEACANMYREIMVQRSLKIGWKICPVYNNLSVQVCRKCSGLGHNARTCENVACSNKCSGEHGTKGCKSPNRELCANCETANENNLMVSDNNEDDWEEYTRVSEGDMSSCKASITSQHTSLKIMQMNICSLDKHFEEFLVLLEEIGGYMDVIVLTETWELGNIGLYNIPGYDIYYNEGMLTQNDGTGMFMKNTLKYTVNLMSVVEGSASK
ncbi:hypothetical protein QAD02_012567 [Eretmocerus hayati]|uniref:Uncharacterized protein n=1 Tax=Eretmocerus hayati TaxID=131215 RepID=A0ACC2NZT3_9HYME|nr:hypothetical protein QAD02_012567 [Eretmocerus hayati]